MGSEMCIRDSPCRARVGRGPGTSPSKNGVEARYSFFSRRCCFSRRFRFSRRRRFRFSRRRHCRFSRPPSRRCRFPRTGRCCSQTRQNSGSCCRVFDSVSCRRHRLFDCCSPSCSDGGPCSEADAPRTTNVRDGSGGQAGTIPRSSAGDGRILCEKTPFYSNCASSTYDINGTTSVYASASAAVAHGPPGSRGFPPFCSVGSASPLPHGA